jgi:hypothetical protein
VVEVVQTQGDQVASTPRIRETGIAQVMTSTSIGKHPTALYSTGLPILQVALDVEAMTEVLEPMLSRFDDGEGASVTYAKLVAYKQGNRGLIDYEVGAPSGGPRQPLVGKLFPSPDRAERVLDVMQQLAVVYAGHGSLHVPTPLGCVPELGMLVYVPVPGRVLDEVIAEAQPGIIDAVAEWLHVLASSGIRVDRRFDLDAELVNAQGWAALIEHHEPDVSASVREVMRGVRSLAPSLRLRTDAIIHKDFHYRHVLVDGGVGVVDFDEVRSGDPTLDVAHFCAHLRLLRCRTATAAAGMFDRLEAEFLRAYSARGGWEPDARLSFFTAYTCLKVAKQLCTSRGVRPRPEGDEARRQLDVMLEEGLRAIDAHP